MMNYEKLGVFYLGKQYDLAGRRTDDMPILYEAKDLCTHAVCVGMTGSGKTGLCIDLLEEAAIDGIPSICIDPKGDLGNLLLTFPDLATEDFLPFVDPAEATTQGLSAEELAAKTAATWKQGLATWDQDAQRVQRLRDAVDYTIYTPGASVGVPLTVLRSFSAPPTSTRDNTDAMRERLVAASAGLLALLGIEGDPLRSREHIFIMNILSEAWQAGRNVDLVALVRSIQQPPFRNVGAIDVESFFPAKERFQLALQLNNLLASPGFSAWMEGEPLDIQRMLYTPAGKPRMAIISIAHLSDSERMFFVTLLLNEIIAWMRTQPGTASLRAVLYMDEVFGYFPPTANPPSKMPMLTLLKQARAYGLGVVLATQNPVDLDYKGLSNAGTWFLGRLQTERDKARVLDGLEGATAAAGTAFDRAGMERALSGLGNRVFLMNNVHDDHPVIFQSRWALSYLRGPLTRDQISMLMQHKKQPNVLAPTKTTSTASTSSTLPTQGRPMLPPGVVELFQARRDRVAAGSTLIYRPQLLGEVKIHFADAKIGVDQTDSGVVRVAIGDATPADVWEQTEFESGEKVDLDGTPDPTARFAELPTEFTQPKTYTSLATQLKDHLYRDYRITLFKAAALKQSSTPGESEGDFRARLSHRSKEQRDQGVEKLKQKYAARFASLQEQLRKAQQRVQKEKEQASGQVFNSMITVGTSILGAFMGRKVLSATNMSKAATGMRSASKVFKERQDVGFAEDTVEVYQQRLHELEKEFQEESAEISTASEADVEIESVGLRPKKSDIAVNRVALLWTPWLVEGDAGEPKPAF